MEPVYLDTFVQSFQLAITSTVFTVGSVSHFGYFMAKLPAGGKKKAMLLLMLPFWVVRHQTFTLDVDHPSEKRRSQNFVLKSSQMIESG